MVRVFILKLTTKQRFSFLQRYTGVERWPLKSPSVAAAPGQRGGGIFLYE